MDLAGAQDALHALNFLFFAVAAASELVVIILNYINHHHLLEKRLEKGLFKGLILQIGREKSALYRTLLVPRHQYNVISDV